LKTIDVAIIGSGNIGTDLLMKINSRFPKNGAAESSLRVAAFVGNDPQSVGLARARDMGIATTHEGIDGLLQMPDFDKIQVVFDASSAAAHPRHAELLTKNNVPLVDLTPAAIGPYVIPTVNLDQHLTELNINLVTCGGQATIPIVHAVNRIAPVTYAEIVSSIASKSAGTGTRANIDEFTETTARAIERVGGATHGKAIIVLNPAEPPILMRNTVFCFVEGQQPVDKIEQSIQEMVAEVQTYVPGYRLKQKVIFDQMHDNDAITIPGIATNLSGTKVTVYLEVEGAGDFLPTYAGNLDIMTSAALATGQRLVQLRNKELGV
jgi:acetaldehyde dehydrogenase